MNTGEPWQPCSYNIVDYIGLVLEEKAQIGNIGVIKVDCIRM